jgi:hypothetical protein
VNRINDRSDISHLFLIFRGIITSFEVAEKLASFKNWHCMYKEYLVLSVCVCQIVKEHEFPWKKVKGMIKRLGCK